MDYLTVEFNLQSGVIPFRGRYGLPRVVHAHLDNPTSPVLVDVEIEVSETRAQARQVTLTAREGELVTTGAMRDVKVPQIVSEAMSRVALKAERTAPDVTRLTKLAANEVEDFYEAWRRSGPRGSRLDIDHFQDVVLVYRTAQQRGEPPTKTVADVLGGSYSSAGRWVMKAREKGLLEEAPGPGRSGEKES